MLFCMLQDVVCADKGEKKDAGTQDGEDKKAEVCRGGIGTKLADAYSIQCEKDYNGK